MHQLTSSACFDHTQCTPCMHSACFDHTQCKPCMYRHGVMAPALADHCAKSTLEPVVQISDSPNRGTVPSCTSNYKTRISAYDLQYLLRIWIVLDFEYHYRHISTTRHTSLPLHGRGIQASDVRRSLQSACCLATTQQKSRFEECTPAGRRYEAAYSTEHTIAVYECMRSMPAAATRGSLMARSPCQPMSGSRRLLSTLAAALALFACHSVSARSCKPATVITPAA